MKFLYLFLLFFLYHGIISGQIIGNVTDTSGNSLAFVSVYTIDGKTGTTTNLNGDYELKLSSGLHSVAFQYTGFKKKILSILVKDSSITVNVSLVPDPIMLSEVEFIASKEDPAYSIIRKAIQKRKRMEYFKQSYEYNSYSKGLFRIIKAPNKIMGRDLGNLSGILDSNRQGTLYLSEAVTHVQFKPPSDYSEKMIASKVAGSENGLSLNWASSLSVNLYRNESDIGKPVISPISDMALSFYKYVLLNSVIDEAGVETHKIKIIPKNAFEACWTGYIYISETDSCISGFDAWITGSQIKREFVDTINLRQEFSFMNDLNSKMLRTQYYKIQINFLGLKLQGDFGINLSNYNLTNNGKLNVRENYIVLPGSNVREKVYWDSVRSIPLTEFEIKEFKSKDSLIAIKKSSRYLDSMDAISNKIHSLSLLTGYTFRNSIKKYDISWSGIISSFSFNPINGFLISPQISYNHKGSTTSNSNRLSFSVYPNYGFGENRFRVHFKLFCVLNSMKQSSLTFFGGNRLSEYNYDFPVDKLINTFGSLIFKNNHFKAYHENFIGIRFKTDINYDLTGIFEIKYSDRSEVFNTTNYSFRNRNKIFLPNTEVGNPFRSLEIKYPRVVTTMLDFIYQPNTSVWKTPEFIERLDSDWPVFRFQFYGYYYNYFISKVRFDITYFKTFGIYGNGSITARFTQKMGTGVLESPEWNYIFGQAFPVYFIPTQSHFSFGLANYDLFSIDRLLESSISWNFNGLLFDKLPWINRLRINEHLRFYSVLLKSNEYVYELSAGFSNLGYKYFRPFRIDLTFQFNQSGYSNMYLKFGIVKILNTQ